MALPDRHLLLGITLGALCATGLALTGPGWASDALANAARTGIDPDALVRIGDDMFNITYEDWVATEPDTNSTIRKIGYGRVEYVHVATTATGTYSSDGLASPHISYAGISVEPLGLAGSILLLGGDGAWIAAPAGGHTVQNLRLSGSDRLVTFGDLACSVSNSFIVC